MEGINYIVDADNSKIAVQIDLKTHGELWEDFYDLLTFKARKEEERVSLESVVEELKKEGLIDEQVQHSI